MLTLKMKGIYLLLLSLIIGGCSFSSSVTIKSDQDKVDVYISKVTETTSTKVGSTPLSLKGSDLTSKYGISGPARFELKKIGYYDSKVIVTDLQSKNLDLMLNMKALDHAEYTEKLNFTINELFNVQKLVRKQQYPQALASLEAMKKDFPYLSVLYEMEGGVHILQRNFSLALDAFSNAIKYDANNAEASRMKKDLERKLQLRGTGTEL